MFGSKTYFFHFLAVLLLAWSLGLNGCKKKSDPKPPPPPPLADTMIRAADLSFLPQIEDHGTPFYDSSGIQKDILTLFMEAGMNTVRVRLWHDPVSAHSSFGEVAGFCDLVRTKGLKIWLDLHYSDTWADPGQQATPQAWAMAGYEALKDSVNQYTRRVMQRIRPDIVQVGNEINHGFLWETGRISNESQFLGLLRSGVAAVREVDAEAHILIHYAGWAGAGDFYDLLDKSSIDHDLIGLSFYPWWHGMSFDSLENALNQLSLQFGKKVLLAEIAYPFTLDWNDQTFNVIGLENQLMQGYPATADGQAGYLLRLKALIGRVGKGAGFCYWAPEWVAYKGPQATDGSSWENLALFDFTNKALPGLELFRPVMNSSNNQEKDGDKKNPSRDAERI